MRNIPFIIMCLSLGLFLWACTPTHTSEQSHTDTSQNTTETTTPSPFVDNSTPLATIIDTSAQTIMERLFGSYSEEEKKSLVEAGNIKETDLKEKANIDGADDLKAQMEYKAPLGDGRILFVVSAGPDGNDCHVCAPLIGAGLLYPNSEKWDIKGFKFFDVAGKYGIAPDMETQQISPNDYALVQNVADIHMGFYYEGMSLHSINNGFTEILAMPIHEDNSGGCDIDGNNPDFPKCFENDTKITYEPAGNDYYKIHTHKTGTDWDFDRDELITLDEKKTYTYQNGVYKE